MTVKACRCECGYRCGGPGRCKLKLFDCVSQPEGHFVRDCEHKWDGPWEEIKWPGGGASGSATCSRCGISVMEHDMRCGP